MKWFIAAVLQYLDSNQVLWFWGPWTESYTYLQSYVHVMSQTIHEVWLIKQRWQRRQREHDLKKELRSSEKIISWLLQVTGVFLKLSPGWFPMLFWGTEIIQSLEQRGLTAESTVVFIAPFEFRNISFAREWVLSPEPSQCYRNCNISDFVMSFYPKFVALRMVCVVAGTSRMLTTSTGRVIREIHGPTGQVLLLVTAVMVS